MNAGPFYKFATPLGEYACNLTSVYKRPNHEARNLWVPLINPADPKFIHAYLKMDLFVYGEFD